MSDPRWLFLSLVAAVVLSLSAGMDVTEAGEVAPGSLIKAVKQGDVALLRTLLARKANANASDETGRTALMYAASYEDGTPKSDATSMAMARALLRGGARVNAVSRHDESAILLAAVKTNADVVKLLLEKGAKVHIQTVNGSVVRLSVPVKSRKPRATLRLSVHGDTVEGEYVSGAHTSAWKRPSDPRAERTLTLLKEASRKHVKR